MFIDQYNISEIMSSAGFNNFRNNLQRKQILRHQKAIVWQPIWSYSLLWYAVKRHQFVSSHQNTNSEKVESCRAECQITKTQYLDSWFLFSKKIVVTRNLHKHVVSIPYKRVKTDVFTVLYYNFQHNWPEMNFILIRNSIMFYSLISTEKVTSKQNK